MKCEDSDKFGIYLADLYKRLRDELGRDHRGMDPNDRTRAPIAMAILAYANAGFANIQDIEVAVRRALGLSGQGSIRTAMRSTNPETALDTACA